jgi:hypothetical protein
MDYTISDTMVNEFRYGHQSASVDFNRPEREAGPQLNFNTFTTPISTLFAQGRNSPVNEFTDNLTKVHGHHTFKFGGQVRLTDEFGFNDAGIYPNISLSTANGNIPAASVSPTGLSSTQLTTFQGLYNDLLGRISSVTQTFYSNLSTFQAAGTPRVRNFEFHEQGWFAQDDWRVSPRLTLSVGLRWEFFPSPYELNGQQGILAPTSDLNVATQNSTLTIQRSSHWYPTDYHSFAPRFGFAWDPWGDGKTAVRGGYGIFYNRTIGAAADSVDGATPGFTQASTIFPNAAGTDVRIGTAPPLPVEPTAPILTLPATRSFGTADVFSPNLTNSYVMQWNFNIQRQIAKSTIIDIGYVANRGVKQFYEINLNQSHIFDNGFLSAFQQLAAGVNSPSSLPATNPIVQIFGTASAAISSIGASNLTNGAVGTAAATIDQSFYTKYANAGLSQYYLRNFPQFQSVLLGNNDGRSEYNSLQARVTRQVGALRVTGNFTWSKSLDNDQSALTGGEGNGFAAPLDSFNESLVRGRSNFDVPYAFTMTGLYTLPIGRGQALGHNIPNWLNSIVGGWDVGGLWIWESGQPFSVSSGFATGPSTAATFANYTGSRNIGGITTSPLEAGVYYFTPAQIANFSEPTAGTYGTSDRNDFRGPSFFNVDTSLVKRFAVAEKKYLTFRAEAYNVFNVVDFANPSVNFGGSKQTFGKISAVVNNPRIMQLALRFDF